MDTAPNVSSAFCCSLVLLEASLGQLCGMEEPGNALGFLDFPVPAFLITVSFPEEFLEMGRACRVKMFFL